MAQKPIILVDHTTNRTVEITVDNNITSDVTITLPTAESELVTSDSYKKTINTAAKEVASTVEYIVQPTIVDPIMNATSVAGSITSSAYTTLNTYIGRHISTDWEIATDPEFTQLEVSNYQDAINKINFTFNPLFMGKVYYVRCRHHSENYVSSWSEGIKFTSSVIIISAPTVIVAGDATAALVNTEINTLPYSITGGDNQHISSDWEVSLTSDFSNLIYSSYTDKIHLTRIDLANLLYSTTYYVRCKHNSSIITSNWSNTVMFKTQSITDTPIITAPGIGYEYSDISISIDNYNSNNTYTISVTAGTTTINNGVITWSLPQVVNSIDHTITIRARDLSHANAAISLPIGQTITVLPLAIDTGVATSVATTKTTLTNGNICNADTYNILANTKVSEPAKLYFNTNLASVVKGDILYTDNNKIVTVADVVDSGITNKDYIDVVDFVVSNGHSLLLLSDNSVWSTGDNAYGQRGAPAPVGTYFSFTGMYAKKIAVGFGYSCIIGMDDEVYVCGSNTSGALGLIEVVPGSSTTYNAFSKTGIKAKDIFLASTAALESTTTYASTMDNKLAISGYNNGKYGNNTTNRSNGWTILDISVKKVWSGNDVTFIVKSDDTVWYTGTNSTGALGQGANTSFLTWTPLTTLGGLPIVTPIKQLYIKNKSSYLIDGNNDLWVTGNNTSGQLGLGNINNYNVWTKTNKKAKSITSNDSHAAYIGMDNKVYVAGTVSFQNYPGFTNTYYTTWTYTGVITDKLYNSSIELLIYSKDNKILATGFNTNNVLANGLGGDTVITDYLLTRSVPVQTESYIIPEETLYSVPKALFPKYLSGSYYTSVANTSKEYGMVKNIKSVYSKSDIMDTAKVSTVNKLYINNLLAELKLSDKIMTNTGAIFNIKSINKESTPSIVSSQSRLSTGVASAFINNSTVMTTAHAIGLGTKGENGLLTGTNIYAFTAINGYSRIAAGSNHGICIKDSDNTAYTFGLNTVGQLGVLPSVTPYSIAYLSTGITAMATAAANASSYIVGTDGYVYVSGDNSHGQLGTGSFTNVTGFTNTGIQAVKVIAGYNCAIAIKENGEAYACGSNSNYKLGLSLPIDYPEWTALGIYIKDAALGVTNSYAIDLNSNLLVIGPNTGGMLGIGQDTTAKTTWFNTGRKARAVRVERQLNNGAMFACYLSDDYKLYGTGTYGMLGIPSTYDWTFMLSDIMDVEYSGDRILVINLKGNLSGIGDNKGNCLVNALVNTRRYGWSTSSTTLLQSKSLSYATGYWIELDTTLISVPTSLHRIPNVIINGMNAIPVSGSIGAYNTINYADLEFAPSREINTVIESLRPVGTINTTFNLYKLL